MIWKGIVGRNFTPDAFREYVAGLTWGEWQPEFIVLHHTAIPSLVQRPSGFTREHLLGLEKSTLRPGQVLVVFGSSRWNIMPSGSMSRAALSIAIAATAFSRTLSPRPLVKASTLNAGQEKKLKPKNQPFGIGLRRA
jgi:hypothetical protein